MQVFLVCSELRQADKDRRKIAELNEYIAKIRKQIFDHTVLWYLRTAKLRIFKPFISEDDALARRHQIMINFGCSNYINKMYVRDALRERRILQRRVKDYENR